MAISRWISAIHQPKGGGWRYKILNNTINYVLNPEKTDGGLLTGSFNCRLDKALDDMIQTKKRFGQEKKSRNDRLGYHFLVSFSPDEDISDEIAYQVVREFTKRWIGEDYECVFGIHNDKGHKHGHICLNSVNIHTGRKLRYEDGDWAEKIQPLLDEICQKYGVHTLEMDTGMNPATWKATEEQNKKKAGRRKKANETGTAGRHEHYKESQEQFNKNDMIRFDIDDSIRWVASYEEFLQEMQNRGYKIKIGKNGETLALLPTGGGYSRYRRTYSLGRDYTVNMIKMRIGIKQKPLPVFLDSMDVRLAVPYSFFGIGSPGIKKTRYNKALKMYYARLYRLGVKPRKANSSYTDCRKRLSMIRLCREKIYIVGNYNAFTPENTDVALKAQRSQILETDKELKAAYRERMPYKQMISDFNKWRKLDKLLAPSAGQLLQKEDLKKRLDAYPFSMEEVEKFVSGSQKRIRGLRKQKRELNKVISVLEEVKDSYDDAIPATYEEDYTAYGELENAHKRQEEQENEQKNRTKKTH